MADDPSSPVRRPGRQTCLAAVTAVLAVTATVGPALLTGDRASAAATSVQVYWSSESRTAGYGPGSGTWFSDPATGVAGTPYRLSKQSDATIAGASGTATITVDPSQRFQTVLGVGSSLEESTIFNLSRMSATAREQTLRALVDPAQGGFSVARITFGSPDFTGRDFYTYDDGPADPLLANFSLQKDLDYHIVDTLKQARAINPDLKLFASVWSPPGWMKSSGSLIGGSLLDEHIATLAAYYRKAVQAYAAQGLPIHAVTLQNEPQFSPPDYPGMLVSADQERRLAKALRTEFGNAGLDTRIWAFDHNFAQGADYAAGVLGAAGSPSDAYSSVDGIAFHDYDGDPSAMAQVKSAYPDKDVLMTERAVFGAGGADRIAQYFRNQSTLYQGWVTMLDQNIAPEKWSGVPSSTPLVQSTSNRDTVYYTPDYYMIAQYARFVRPGAQRVASNYGSADTVTNVAFRNSDGTLATVVVNRTGSDQTFTLRVGSQQISSTLPAKTVGTYLWAGADSGGGSGAGPIVSRANAKCLDVTDGSTTNGNLPQMWTCYSGNTNQAWAFGADGTVRGQGKCLDVKDHGTNDGAVVQLWDCFAGPNQKWQKTAAGELVNDGSGKCLDIKDNNRSDGAKLQIWSCSGGDNQKWTFPA